MRQFLLLEPEQYGWHRSPRLEAAGSRHKHKTPPLHITDNRTIAMVYHHTAPLQCTGVSPYHCNGVSPQHFNVCTGVSPCAPYTTDTTSTSTRIRVYIYNSKKQSKRMNTNKAINTRLPPISSHITTSKVDSIAGFKRWKKLSWLTLTNQYRI